MRSFLLGKINGNDIIYGSIENIFPASLSFFSRIYNYFAFSKYKKNNKWLKGREKNPEI